MSRPEFDKTNRIGEALDYAAVCASSSEVPISGSFIAGIKASLSFLAPAEVGKIEGPEAVINSVVKEFEDFVSKTLNKDTSMPLNNRRLVTGEISVLNAGFTTLGYIGKTVLKNRPDITERIGLSFGRFYEQYLRYESDTKEPLPIPDSFVPSLLELGLPEGIDIAIDNLKNTASSVSSTSLVNVINQTTSLRDSTLILGAFSKKTLTGTMSGTDLVKRTADDCYDKLFADRPINEVISPYIYQPGAFLLFKKPYYEAVQTIFGDFTTRYFEVAVRNYPNKFTFTNISNIDSAEIGEVIQEYTQSIVGDAHEMNIAVHSLFRYIDPIMKSCLATNGLDRLGFDLGLGISRTSDLDLQTEIIDTVVGYDVSKRPDDFDPKAMNILSKEVVAIMSARNPKYDSVKDIILGKIIPEKSHGSIFGYFGGLSVAKKAEIAPKISPTYAVTNALALLEQDSYCSAK